MRWKHQYRTWPQLTAAAVQHSEHVVQCIKGGALTIRAGIYDQSDRRRGACSGFNVLALPVQAIGAAELAVVLCGRPLHGAAAAHLGRPRRRLPPCSKHSMPLRLLLLVNSTAQ